MSDTTARKKDKKRAPLTGVFRPAIIKDAKTIQDIVKIYAEKGQMLPRSLNELYETIRQYMLYEEDGQILGVCGLHITWEDLAEIRALAVRPEHGDRGIGSSLVERAMKEAKRLGVAKVFTLTYVPGFFAKMGFEVVEKQEFPHKIWSECVRCHKFPDCDETGMIRPVD